MKIYEDITPALQSVLRSWSTGDVGCWVSFVVHRDKLDGIREKWIENYGTNLSAEKRRWRKRSGLPTATACAVPILGFPHKVECILLASSQAIGASGGAFSREKWLTRPPEIGDFVMVQEPRERGDYRWTWRIQQRQLGLLGQHLTALVKLGDGQGVAANSHGMVRLYPMFGGVRRQVRRLLRSSQKLWDARSDGGWPGPDPEALPAMVGYRKERVVER